MTTTTGPTLLERPLAATLESRRWLRREVPFRHFVAYDVFTPQVYTGLERAYRDVIASVAGESYLAGHDIYGTTINAELAPLFQPLASRAWHNLIAELTGVDASGHVAMGLHHHRVGSADGFPHNDLNPGWFGGDPSPMAIELSDLATIEYTTGTAKVAGVQPRELVRAVAVLFYLANPDWRSGDGGVTGLYRSAVDDPRRPVSVVPPLNNSLLAFECTPTSWHGFISNRRHPRSSLIMWLHRPRASVVARWGADAIVPYGAVG